MSENALNHRFRRLRAEAVIIHEGRKQGIDMKALPFEGDLPATQGAVDKESTLGLISLPMPPVIFESLLECCEVATDLIW
jgi:hypothetical protein